MITAIATNGAQPAADTATLQRRAMSYLMLAGMELNWPDSKIDDAYQFAAKALDAIGTLRVTTIGGRAAAADVDTDVTAAFYAIAEGTEVAHG